MRSDYILYVVAVICFIIAGVFVAGAIPLGTSEMNLTVTAIFFILGIIFAVGGYALRSKAAAPMPTVSQPPPAEPFLPLPQLPPVEEKMEEAPAVPPPVVEAPPPVEEAPVIEHIPPPVEEVAPTEPTRVPTLEEPAKCPKCGTEVSSPKKKWTMAGRPDKSGKRMQLEIGLFDCPKCHKPFRVVLSQKKVRR
jgi:outer membrane biosynthesis protein TonB